MNQLSKFVSGAVIDSAVAPMPLVHTTSVFSARHVLSAMALQPSKDQIYEESLLYLFYGKPAYFPQTKNAGSMIFHAPIFFVIKPSAVTSARRVLPFDSGAFSGGRYAPYLHSRMTKADFEVDIDLGHSGGTPFPQSAQKIVAAFYKNNRDYYRGDVRRDIEIRALDFEARVCFELISSKEATDFDERASIIEVQISKSLALSNDTILAIMLPVEMLADPMVKACLDAMPRVTTITYTSFRSKPEYFSALAVEKIGVFLENEGFLSG